VISAGGNGAAGFFCYERAERMGTQMPSLMKPGDPYPQRIEIGPANWSQAIPSLVSAMRDSELGRRMGLDELGRLARIADASSGLVDLVQTAFAAGAFDGDGQLRDRVETLLGRCWIAQTAAGPDSLRPVGRETGEQLLEPVETPFAHPTIVVWRPGPRSALAAVRTNVPRSAIYHSPTGFEFGYGGSGPADLALCILAAIVPPGTDGAEAVDCSSGTVSQTAMALHQRFKDHVSGWSGWGVEIPTVTVRKWIHSRIDEAERAGAVHERLFQILAAGDQVDPWKIRGTVEFVGPFGCEPGPVASDRLGR